jgi:His-Xaa-Ser system radical SAM maturase HxsB
MRRDLMHAACDTVFDSSARQLTIEFQGGDPLLRVDLVRSAVERIAERNLHEKRDIRFVVASTLHQLDEAMCAFFKAHNVYLSTSVDGPEALHNSNRPTPERDAFARTVNGVRIARELLSSSSVSALMTTTRHSLAHPEAIVDTYVDLGFDEIFIRPLSLYGFAKRNFGGIGYSQAEFAMFYKRAFERLLYWNRCGVNIREVTASIAFNKILSPFDAGYVDLQSPSGAGLASLVYNYDGYVYPSDEARMLAAAGDTSLRLGHIGEPLAELLKSDIQKAITASSVSRVVPGCRDCAYNAYCGPDPIGTYNEYGSLSASVHDTAHCRRQIWLFDFLFDRLRTADSWFEGLAHRWAQPPLRCEPTLNA